MFGCWSVTHFTGDAPVVGTSLQIGNIIVAFIACPGSRMHNFIGGLFTHGISPVMSILSK
jgi:hypothetical protein